MMVSKWWLYFGFLLFTGCSQASQSSSKQSAFNEREAGQDWSRFVYKAKSRKKEAQIAWQRKFDKGDLTIEFLRDDVKLDSARGTMTGEIQLKTSEYTILSYKDVLPGGGFGKGSGSDSDYTLRFCYSLNTWRFMDGIRNYTFIYNQVKFPSNIDSLNESHYFHLQEMFHP